MTTSDHLTDTERAEMQDAGRGHLLTEALIANRHEAVALRDFYGDCVVAFDAYQDAMDDAAEEHLEREAEKPACGHPHPRLFDVTCHRPAGHTVGGHNNLSGTRWADGGQEPCSCDADLCDEEGDPGCTYCRGLDGELPCPAESEEGL